MPGNSIGTAYVQVVPTTKGIAGMLTKQMSGDAQSAGLTVGGKIGSFVKKAVAAAGIGKVLMSGIKASINEGAKLQQSYQGGLETLYGDAAEAARAHAREAATAGISMNEYSEQAVSFGAALKNAYGGDTLKAANAANTAILDMADNAAKMGTPLESIQNAYQGFAKQNYTMLDNLKLGYGGTKSEMERLLKRATELSGVEYDISNLGDVYSAIHVIQNDLELTGSAADEASKTFSGSFGAMKAAGANLMGSMALGEGVKPALSAFLTTVKTFVFNNFIPMIGTIVSGFPTLIAGMITTGIPMLLTGIGNVVRKIANGITKTANGLTGEKVKNWITTTIPKMLSSAAKLIKTFATGLITNIPKIVKAVGKIGLTIIKGLGSAIWGKVKAAANGVKNFFIGPINTLKEKVSGVVDKIKNFFNFSGVTAKVSEVAGKVKEKFSAPINTLKEKVSEIVDKIKGFFGFKITPPNIPKPHFSITPAGWRIGDLLQGSIPKLGIEWYAKGGIATKPVIGFGEAGPEALLPLNPFWERMDRIAENAKEHSGNITINVYGQPGMTADQIAAAVEKKLIKTQKNRRTAWTTA